MKDLLVHVQLETVAFPFVGHSSQDHCRLGIIWSIYYFQSNDDTGVFKKIPETLLCQIHPYQFNTYAQACHPGLKVALSKVHHPNDIWSVVVFFSLDGREEGW